MWGMRFPELRVLIVEPVSSARTEESTSTPSSRGHPEARGSHSENRSLTSV
jgi:hypothetical protein